MITGGRLRVDWIFCQALHRRPTIETLSAAFLAHLHRLIAHCLTPDAGAYTTSDFQLAGLSTEELNAVFEDLGNPA
jgi:non-ribosomal peptide synthase protein (TIGR01720 family)